MRNGTARGRAKDGAESITVDPEGDVAREFIFGREGRTPTGDSVAAAVFVDGLGSGRPEAMLVGSTLLKLLALARRSQSGDARALRELKKLAKPSKLAPGLPDAGVLDAPQVFRLLQGVFRETFQALDDLHRRAQAASFLRVFTESLGDNWQQRVATYPRSGYGDRARLLATFFEDARHQFTLGAFRADAKDKKLAYLPSFEAESKTDRISRWAKAIGRVLSGNEQWDSLSPDAKAKELVQACFRAAGYPRPSDLKDADRQRARRKRAALRTIN